MTPAQVNVILSALAFLITLNGLAIGYLLRIERRITTIETVCRIKTGCGTEKEA